MYVEIERYRSNEMFSLFYLIFDDGVCDMDVFNLSYDNKDNGGVSIFTQVKLNMSIDALGF